MTGGDDSKSVRTEPGTEDLLRMSQRNSGFKGSQIPKAGRTIFAGRNHKSAILTEGGARQSVRLPKRTDLWNAGLQIVNLGLIKVFRKQDLAAIRAELSLLNLLLCKPDAG